VEEIPFLEFLLIQLYERRLHLLFSSASNLVEEPVANGRSHGKISLLSALGSVLIKTTLMNMKSPAEALWCTQIVFLSKQVWRIVTGRQILRRSFSEPLHF